MREAKPLWSTTPADSKPIRTLKSLWLCFYTTNSHRGVSSFIRYVTTKQKHPLPAAKQTQTLSVCLGKVGQKRSEKAGRVIRNGWRFKRSVDTADHVQVTFISKQFEVPGLTRVDLKNLSDKHDPKRFECYFTFYITTDEHSSVRVDLKRAGPKIFARKLAEHSPLVWWYWWLHLTRGCNPDFSVEYAWKGTSISQMRVSNL